MWPDAGVFSRYNRNTEIDGQLAREAVRRVDHKCAAVGLTGEPPIGVVIA